MRGAALILLAACGAPVAPPTVVVAHGSAAPPPPMRGALVPGLHVDGKIVWSPDGRHVLLAGAEYGAGPDGHEIVDVATGDAIWIDGPHDVVFSPDSARVAVVTPPAVEYRDASDGERLAPPHETTLDREPFLADGRAVWAARDGHDLVVRFPLSSDPRDELRAPATGDRDAIYHVLAGPGDVVIATAATAGTPPVAELLIWKAGTLVARHPRAPGVLPRVDGNLVVFAVPELPEARRMVYVDLAAPTQLVELPAGHGACSRGLTYPSAGPIRCAPGRYAVGFRGHACVWDLAPQKLVRNLEVRLGIDDEMTCDGDGLEVGPFLPGVAYPHYSIDAGKQTRTVQKDPSDLGDDGVPDDVFPSPRGDLSAVVEQGAVTLTEVATGVVVYATAPPPQASEIVFDRRGNLIVGSPDGRSWHVDLARGAMTTTPPIARCSPLRELGVDANGRVIEVCEDQGLTVYREGERVPVLSGISRLALAGDSVAYIDRGAGVVRVWPHLDRSREWTVPVPAGPTAGLGVSSDGESLALEDYDALVVSDRTHELWRARPSGGNTQLVGGRAASRSCSNAVVWDEAGHVLWSDVGPPASQICVLALGPNGERVASRRRVEDVAVRSVRPGAPRTLPIERDRDDDLRRLAWSPDGKRLAAVLHGAVLLWDVAAGGPPAQLLLAGDAGAVITPAGRAQLLGRDAAAARALLDCRIGARLATFEACAGSAAP